MLEAFTVQKGRLKTIRRQIRRFRRHSRRHRQYRLSLTFPLTNTAFQTTSCPLLNKRSSENRERTLLCSFGMNTKTQQPLQRL
ncbi:hypothetical protein HMPREF3156_02867 [Neisseria sp. HMSC06F02]|nr:hypothetical protein HMPREF3156_02867 [Neisseria sp. HMSC06F02]